MDKVLYAWGLVFRRAIDDKHAWGAAILLVAGLAAADAFFLFRALEESGEYALTLFFWHPPVSEPPEYGDWFLSGAALMIPLVFRFISAGYVRRLSPFVVGRLIRGALIFLTAGVWMQLGLLFDDFGDWLFIVSLFAILMIMYGSKEAHGD